MTDIQEKIMELADEIDSICKEEGLNYLLANQTAGRAIENGSFSNNTYEFWITMPLKDVLELKAYVDSGKIKDRTIESWEDNSELPCFSFRYINKSTTLIDGSRGTYFTKPGIAVSIQPLRLGKQTKKAHGRERYLQLCNKGVKHPRRMCRNIILAKAFSKIFGNKTTAKLLGIENIEKYIENTYGLLTGINEATFGGDIKVSRLALKEAIASEKDVKADDNSRYWYLNDAGKKISFKSQVFSNPDYIKFEGRTFPVCSDMAGYFSTIYGSKWKTLYKKSYPISSAIRVIAETDLPYEEYLEFIKGREPSLKEIIHYKRLYNSWYAKEYLPREKKVNHTFARVRRSVDRIDIWQKMKSRREALLAARDNKDTDTMKKLLREYLKKTDEYSAEKIGFYIDDELFECARMIWETEGRPKYADTVYSYVPELYKKESVDDYFNKMDN